MKKILLLCFLIVTVKLSAQKTLTIDSLNIYTAYNGQLVKVYTTTTGAWTASYPLTLRLNGSVMISGTYQTLLDSNNVWSFIVPGSIPAGYTTITLYSSSVYINILHTTATGITEYNLPEKFDSIVYYNVSGQEIIKPESGAFIERYFYKGEIISTRKVFK